MFNRRCSNLPVMRASLFSLEGLENRTLLSAASSSVQHEGTQGSSGAPAGQIILFAAAPAAVENGLQTLAGSTTIPADQPVHESTIPGGTEIYAIKLTSAGTSTVYAVNSAGTAVPVPQPPQSNGSGGATTGGSIVIDFNAAPAAVQTGLQTLAGSTTIRSDQPVHESTVPGGTEIYAIKLTVNGNATVYAVDSTGAAVPVPPPPQQGGTTGGSTSGGSRSGGSTSGGTGTGGTGTGGTSAGGTGTGGTSTGGTGPTVIDFSAAPSAVQTGLQTLAGSNTIPADQPVHESTVPGGTEIYAIKLTVSGTPTVYAVDASGNAAPVPPPPPQAPSSAGSQGSSTAGNHGSATGDQPTPPPQQDGQSDGRVIAT